jgi:hypothetical protein
VLPDLAFFVASAVHYWYGPAVVLAIVFTYGFYRNREKEKQRAKLTDAELVARLGDIPGSGGATESYADAELPDPRRK